MGMGMEKREEDRGEKAGRHSGYRDAMFNWQLFSLAHRNRSEGGRAGGAGGGAGLLSRVRAARGERSGARVPVGGCQWRRGAWLGQRVVPRKGDAE